jgi:uncharacterized protein YceK
MQRRMQILFLAAAILCNVSGCASIAAYEASHPPYRFPASNRNSG